jgi:hypothetical protein
LQVYSQAPLVHATVAFVMAAQGVHEVPHEFTLVESEQLSPHTW